MTSTPRPPTSVPRPVLDHSTRLVLVLAPVDRPVTARLMSAGQPHLSGARRPLKRERDRSPRRYIDSDSWTRVLENESPYPDTSTLLPEYTFRLNINPRQPPASRGWKPSPFPIAPAKLPPYPVIRSRFLRERAGRNYSQTSGRFGGSADNVARELDCYKRDEIFGDSCLRMLVLYWLIRRYKFLTASSLDRLISLLVCNPMIAWFAWWYGVFGAEKMEELGSDGKAKADSPGTCADMFEAYLGALILDRGMDVATKWIGELYSEEVLYTLAEDIKDERVSEHVKLTTRRTAMDAPPGPVLKRLREAGSS